MYKRQVVAVIGGALASHWLNVTLGLGAVLGAGLVTVLAALIMPAFGAAITCGSFCGMVSMKVLPGVPYLILALSLIHILPPDQELASPVAAI